MAGGPVFDHPQVFIELHAGGTVGLSIDNTRCGADHCGENGDKPALNLRGVIERAGAESRQGRACRWEDCLAA